MTDNAKHSSLLRYGIDNYARKNVYDTVFKNAIFFIFKERRVVETTKLKFGQSFKTFSASSLTKKQDKLECQDFPAWPNICDYCQNLPSGC